MVRRSDMLDIKAVGASLRRFYWDEYDEEMPAFEGREQKVNGIPAAGGCELWTVNRSVGPVKCV